MKLRYNILPGDIGELIRLHGIIYEQEYGFDKTFEAYVAKGIADFVLNYNPKKERLWLAEMDNLIVGSIAIVKASDEEAQLRWYLVTPSFRNKGIGKELMRKAIDFCWQKKYKRIFLWTTGELEAAANVYIKNGFVKSEEIRHVIWGDMRTEERYERELGF